MKRPVLFEKEAAEEYRAAGRWYEEHRPQLGIEFLDAVDSTITAASALPRSGRLIPLVSGDVQARRIAVPRFPYHVVDIETDREIRILAIAHDRREAGYWKTRLV